MKNSRGHSPLDLATEENTKNLILKATKTKACENRDCRSKFDFKNIRYYCEVSHKFFCKKCSVTQWVFEDENCEEKERPVCRSNVVQNKVIERENLLKEAISSHIFENIDKELENCKGVDIDAKLLNEAKILHVKLEHELKIETFLGRSVHHDNYKDIRKDVSKINDMVAEAQNNKIDIEQSII